MPPRISPNRGVHRRGRPSRGEHRGGANRGSQFGGPSSINTGAATPPQTQESTPDVNILSLSQSIPSQIQIPEPVDSPQTNHPTAFRGQPSRNRNRGRGAGRGGVPGSPLSTAISPVVTAPITTETSISATQIPISTQVNPPSTFRGQMAAGNRGRGRGRGAGRGSAPGTPSSVETTTATPITDETVSTASFPHRGQSFRGRGGFRGSARGSPSGSPSPFRGHASRRGGGGGFVAGPSDTTGSPSGIPGK